MKMPDAGPYATQIHPGLFYPNTKAYNHQQESCSTARWDVFGGVLHFLAVVLLVRSICTIVETFRENRGAEGGQYLCGDETCLEVQS